jgi:hypothetical protein
MSEDLIRGGESLDRTSETFILENEFTQGLNKAQLESSVSEDRPLQIDSKSMTEFYLSQKNGRRMYREMA